jgi:hypothetical protein
MIIDRTKFLFIAGSLAASAAGCDRDPFGRAPAPAAPAAPVAAVPSAAAPAGPISVEILPAPTAPNAVGCDDTQGVPEECPSVGPSDEGICPNIIQKRCTDFKAAMKPRVAAQAVACLRALKGSERCDPARITHCGHAALMSACAEPPRPQKGEFHAASGTTPATVTLTPDATPETLPVAVSCTAILKACGERPLSPSLADCKQTLAGMTESGRVNTVECVTAHCTDRGLLGCEAAAKVPNGSGN